LNIRVQEYPPQFILQAVNTMGMKIQGISKKELYNGIPNVTAL
jgi:hypothetical protein